MHPIVFPHGNPLGICVPEVFGFEDAPRVESSSREAEKQLAQLLPFDDLAVLVLEETSLPPGAGMEETRGRGLLGGMVVGGKKRKARPDTGGEGEGAPGRHGG